MSDYDVIYFIVMLLFLRMCVRVFVIIVLTNNKTISYRHNYCKSYTYLYTFSGVADTRHFSKFPDCLGQYVFVIILLQVDDGLSRYGEADNSDVCLFDADLESLGDVNDELLDNVPVQCFDAV